MVHPRFFVPALTLDGAIVVLPPGEAEHLTRVLRLGVGTEVRVFDGRGHEYRALVESAGRREVRVRPIEPVAAPAEPAVALTLAQAVLKGRAMDMVIRDAVMLGVSAVQPIVSARTDVAGWRPERGTAPGRWRRIAVASAKQCGRAVVPDVGAVLEVEEYVGRQDAGCRLILVEPRLPGASPLQARALPAPAAAAASVLVGPEGGWTSAEVERAMRAGFLPVTLGRRTLRADAMPIVIVTLLQYLWGDL